jgi:hypothetical protein
MASLDGWKNVGRKDTTNRQTMGNRQRRSAFHKVLESFLDILFSGGVKGTKTILSGIVYDIKTGQQTLWPRLTIEWEDFSTRFLRLQPAVFHHRSALFLAHQPWSHSLLYIILDEQLKIINNKTCRQESSRFDRASERTEQLLRSHPVRIQTFHSWGKYH